jgi:hypothetical protein
MLYQMVALEVRDDPHRSSYKIPLAWAAFIVVRILPVQATAS